MGLINYLKEMFSVHDSEGRFQEADSARQNGQTSSIVHVGGDQLCFVAAEDDHMKGQIAEAATLSPLVEIISEDGGRMVAAVPWSWVRINVPKQKQL